MEDKLIIEYIENNFPDEMALIERSLINYYSLRNKKDKTSIDIELSQTLYNGVLKLLHIFAIHLSKIYKIDGDILETQLISIFIKT